MKQIKLTPYEAGMILVLLREVNNRQVFTNDTPGSVFDFKNLTLFQIENLTQLLELAQKKKAA